MKYIEPFAVNIRENREINLQKPAIPESYEQRCRKKYIYLPNYRVYII